MTDATFLYVTAPDVKSARSLASALVEARLAACVNILPQMQSVYRWEGKIETADECVLFVKTTAAQSEATRDLILEQHPYDTPCVAALDISATGSNPGLSTVDRSRDYRLVKERC